jgi:hypothetical protein
MMKALAAASNWLGGCFRSAFAWTFLTIHAAWFFAAINAMGPPSRVGAQSRYTLAGADWLIIAGRPLHFHYEPAVVEALVMGDLPATIVCEFVDLCISPLWYIFHLSTYEGSYFGAGEWLLAGSLQWLAIGRLLDLGWRRWISRRLQ